MLTQKELDKLHHDLKGVAYLLELFKREFDKINEDLEGMRENKNEKNN